MIHTHHHHHHLQASVTRRTKAGRNGTIKMKFSTKIAGSMRQRERERERERETYTSIFVLKCLTPQVVGLCFYTKTSKMHQYIKFILLWNDTLLASSQQYLFDSCMCSLELLMMDGNTVRNM